MKNDIRHKFLTAHTPKSLLVVNSVLALAYFVTLAFFFPVGNRVLFSLLIAGEVFHLWQVLTFIYTVWDTNYLPRRVQSHTEPVDVFITVAGEPVELVQETVRAARDMDYQGHAVYVLNDGLVANKDNWRAVEAMAARLGVRCITREVPGGAKAGNINNGLTHTKNPLVVVFDADHVPHKDFLKKTVGYFADPKVAFVQTPQFYKNHAENYLTQGSWEQQELFFGPICKGKNRFSAATMCGTNMVIRRSALVEVGGIYTESVTEDFLTGMFMHARGWKSVYHPEVLAEGLATEDLLSYSKQQFRWARGSLDLIFGHNPLFVRGLTWAQRVQYLASASFYLSGIVVVIDALLPLIFFYTGVVPVHIDSMLLAAIFLPYFFVTLYTIQQASNFTFTFPSLGFSMGAFNIHLRALLAAATFQKSAFAITAKNRLEGNFLPLVTWHIVYSVLALVGFVVALLREGFSASLVNNSAWALLMVVVFAPFIRAALPEPRLRVPVVRSKPKPYDIIPIR